MEQPLIVADGPADASTACLRRSAADPALQLTQCAATGRSTSSSARCLRRWPDQIAVVLYIAVHEWRSGCTEPAERPVESDSTLATSSADEGAIWEGQAAAGCRRDGCAHQSQRIADERRTVSELTDRLDPTDPTPCREMVDEGRAGERTGRDGADKQTGRVSSLRAGTRRTDSIRPIRRRRARWSTRVKRASGRGETEQISRLDGSARSARAADGPTRSDRSDAVARDGQ